MSSILVELGLSTDRPTQHNGDSFGNQDPDAEDEEGDYQLVEPDHLTFAVEQLKVPDVKEFLPDRGKVFHTDNL